MGLEHASPGTQPDVLVTACLHQKGCQFYSLAEMGWERKCEVQLKVPLENLFLIWSLSFQMGNDMTDKCININPGNSLGISNYGPSYTINLCLDLGHKFSLKVFENKTRKSVNS